MLEKVPTRAVAGRVLCLLCEDRQRRADAPLSMDVDAWDAQAQAKLDAALGRHPASRYASASSRWSAIAAEVGWYNPPIMLLISTAFFGLDQVGAMLEQPFGVEAADVSLLHMGA